MLILFSSTRRKQEKLGKQYCLGGVFYNDIFLIFLTSGSGTNVNWNMLAYEQTNDVWVDYIAVFIQGNIRKCGKKFKFKFFLEY